jgi:hypothetical protein
MGVIIGMDAHKRSATIEVIDERGTVLSTGRFGTDKVGYRYMLAEGRRFGERVWAIEAQRHRQTQAHRLVHDGEVVIDVPPKLSAQVASRPAAARRSGRCAFGGDGRVPQPWSVARRGR